MIVWFWFDWNSWDNTKGRPDIQQVCKAILCQYQRGFVPSHDLLLDLKNALVDLDP
jgi:hypothetical protein